MTRTALVVFATAIQCAGGAVLAAQTQSVRSPRPVPQAMPRLLHQVEPQYTSEAMKHHIQGKVGLECLVRTDGTVGDVRVVRSVDRVYGLDDAAVKAARQWRFVPGTRDGVAADIWVTIDMAFVLAHPHRRWYWLWLH